MMKELHTPILFLTFNRKKQTEKVFESIKGARPKKLYISSDGPRTNKSGEEEIVKSLRNDLLSKIDWDCECLTLFRNENLGCKYAVSSAIDWFFENEEMGIILEDDCLPSDSFYFFCQDLLEKYKDDTNILHIGGTNPLDKAKSSSEYYFSKYNRIWGWASWRRAWRHYDVEIKDWPDFKREKVWSKGLNFFLKWKYERLFDKVYNNEIDTWDYQWFLIRLVNGDAIIPKVNLVSNIGFGENATHTDSKTNPLSNLARGEVVFPLTHPALIKTDYKRDRKWAFFMLKNNILNRVRKFVDHLLPSGL